MTTKLLGRMDRYVLRKFFSTYVVVLLTFIAISVVFDITEKLDDFINSTSGIGGIIVNYYFNFVPYYGILLTPLLLFLSVVFFTSRMTANNEFIAFLNTGTSYYRILVPFLVGASMVCALNIVINHYWLPVANRNRILFEWENLKNNYAPNATNVYFQNERNSFIYLQNYNGADSSGYNFQLSTFKDGKLIRKLTADRVKWNRENQTWRITNYAIRHNKPMLESLHYGRDSVIKLNLNPADFDKSIETIAAYTTPELNRLIKEETLKGSNQVPFYYLEKYKRTAFPFSIIILTIIAVSISTRKVRGGTGLHLFIGIALSFSYIMFQQFFGVFSTNADLHPAFGAWIPNFIYLLIGIIAFRFAPK
ncbi:MAG: LptF/LptG family permease [Bacteroidota bacterium]|jgi:lipopolysaccharide export system permease protein